MESASKAPCITLTTDLAHFIYVVENNVLGTRRK